MTRKCPKCGSYTLDYKAKEGIWRCVKVLCGYRESKKKGENNSHLISLLGSL